MGTQVEEILTIFTADLSGLTDAQRKVRTQFDAFLSQQRAVGSAAETLAGKFSGLEKAGIRLEGSLKGISDFFKGGVGNKIAGFGSVVGTVAVAALNRFGEEAAAAQERLESFNEAFRASSRSNTFAISADGPGSLAGRFTALRDQQRELRKLAEENNPSTGLGRLGQKAGDYLNFGLEAKDRRNLINQGLQSQQSLAGQQEGKLREKVLDSLKDETEVAQELLRGQTDAARLLDMELQKRRELNRLDEAGLLDAKARLEIESKFAAQTALISRQRSVSEKFQASTLTIAKQTFKGNTDEGAVAQARLAAARELEANRNATGKEQSDIKERGELAVRLKLSEIATTIRQTQLEQSLSATRAKDIGDGRIRIEEASKRLAFIDNELRLNQQLTDEKRRQLTVERGQVKAEQEQAKFVRARSEFEQRQSLRVEGLRANGRSEEADRRQVQDETAAKVRDVERAGGSKQEIANERLLGAAKLARLVSEQQANARQYDAARATLSINSTNLADGRKRIEGARAAAAAAEIELRTRKDLTEEQRRGLELQRASAINDERAATQDREFAYRFRPGDLNALNAKEAREQTERDKFDRSRGFEPGIAGELTAGEAAQASARAADKRAPGKQDLQLRELKEAVSQLKTIAKALE